MPSTANDAYAMMRAAIAHPDPVVIIEARELYLTSGEVDVEAPVEAVGGARLRTSGADLLIVTWGRMTKAVLEAAESLVAEGIEASVLDLRWISPLDTASLEKALRGTSGRVLIVHEANVSGGFGAEVAAGIAERHSDLVRGPITRIGLGDSRIPASPILMRALIPGPVQIVDAARALVAAQ
jgi:pyruvate/2-oxoglutarate/acetoin dehydrogenase E1 component